MADTVVILYGEDTKERVEKGFISSLLAEVYGREFVLINTSAYMPSAQTYGLLEKEIGEAFKVFFMFSPDLLAWELLGDMLRLAKWPIGKLLPVMLIQCKYPDTLSNIWYADLISDISFTSRQLENLITVLQGGPPRNNVPSTLRAVGNSPALINNRYRVISPIKQGGMGAIDRAFDTTLNCEVALKRLLDLTDPRSQRAFRQEAELLAGLRNTNLPAVIDFFFMGSTPYLVMDLIEGRDLETVVADDGLPGLGKWLGWLDKMLEVLEYLHSRQPQPVIHRDIKPGNILIDLQGQPVLVDFGSAKGQVLETIKAGMPTVFGLTKAFAPLEQQQGQGTDIRTDLYALAATFYYLLSGKLPEDALIRGGMIASSGIQADPFIPLSQQVTHVTLPAHVDAAISSALAVYKTQRMPDAATFRLAIRGQLQPAVSVSSSPTVSPRHSSPIQFTQGDGQWSANRGMKTLQEKLIPLCTDPIVRRKLLVHVDELLDVRRQAEICGGTEALLNESQAIVAKMDVICLQYFGVSYSDIIMGARPI